MSATIQAPRDVELKRHLGPAYALWTALLEAVEEVVAPLEREWKPSKAPFGRLCLLCHGGRTLLYLTPDDRRVWVGVLLGERAFRLAMAGPLPARIKRLFAESKPCGAGYGIRFTVEAAKDIPIVVELTKIKIAPR